MLTGTIAAYTTPPSPKLPNPQEPYDFLIAVNLTNDQYYAQDLNDTIYFTSKCYTDLLYNITASAPIGSSIIVMEGIFGSQVCHLIIGKAAQSLGAGQIVYQSSTNNYALASALSNYTVGYGHLWLVVQSAADNTNCLLMNDGIYTLDHWSWCTGQLWVSETPGIMQQPYPTKTGNQLVSVGVQINATTISFQNPNGFYMEHR